MPTNTGEDEIRYAASPELICEVCDILQLGDNCRERIAGEILRIGTQFATGREVKCFWGTPGEQRDAIRRLIRATEGMLIALYSVAPEYLVALEPMLEQPVHSLGDEDLISRTRTSLLELHEAAVRFDKAYKPKPGAAVDIILEEAVREMIDLFADSGFDPPKVGPGREGHEPKLRNKEAQAVGKLITGIDSRTELRSVVNMINAVRRGRPPSEPHLHKIWDTAGFGLDYWYAAHRRPRI